MLELADGDIQFFDSYNKDGGRKESTMRTGNQFWLGIAAAQYEKTTGDTKYHQLLLAIDARVSRSEKDANGEVSLLYHPEEKF